MVLVGTGLVLVGTGLVLVGTGAVLVGTDLVLVGTGAVLVNVMLAGSQVSQATSRVPGRNQTQTTGTKSETKQPELNPKPNNRN